MRAARQFFGGLALLGGPATPVLAASGGSMLHGDPIAPVILGVTGLLFFAIIGRFGARQVGLPAVVGELLIGIALGNLGYLLGSDLIVLLREVPQVFDVMSGIAPAATFDGATAADINRVLNGPRGGELIQVAHTVDVFSRYGVIFLLFLVGLESSVEEMRRVGGESARVAVIGVVVPFLSGVIVLRLAMPELSANTDMFVAAALGATSVGITARVLHELGQERSREGRVILGAAVLDDILGLLILAIVSGIVVSGGVEIGNVAKTVALSLAFLFGAIRLGPQMLHVMIKILSRLDIVEAKMFTSFLFVMALAWVANLVGLATIVGAFTAGLVLHDSYFAGAYREHPQVAIKDLIMPLEVILVPIFFILMGIQVKLEQLLHWNVMVLAAGLLVAAILGKLASGLGASRGANRAAIGFGMMPRGEVGLIFASIGKSLGVVGDTLFSAVVVMVIVTTLLAPGLLKWSLRRASVAKPA